jgi:hypothetical protein
LSEGIAVVGFVCDQDLALAEVFEFLCAAAVMGIRLRPPCWGDLIR